MGEHLLCKQRVVSSILSASTRHTRGRITREVFRIAGNFEPGFVPAAAKSGEIIDN